MILLHRYKYPTQDSTGKVTLFDSMQCIVKAFNALQTIVPGVQDLHGAVALVQPKTDECFMYKCRCYFKSITPLKLTRSCLPEDLAPLKKTVHAYFGQYDPACRRSVWPSLHMH